MVATEAAINRIAAITPLGFSPISRSRELKLTKLAVLLNALAQRCTSWYHQVRSWVQTLGINQRSIMSLLVGVPIEVQFPCWEVHRQLVFCSSFCGCSSATLEPPDHENTCRKSSFATAILLRRWRMRARWKAHDPLHRSAWSAADRVANYIVDRPPRWRLRIFVEIRMRQRDENESYQIDSFDRSRLPNH